MYIVKKLQDLPVFDRPTALSIGNFDALHRGHQFLISHLKKKSMLSTLVSYSSPLSTKSPLSILSTEQKIHLFEMLQIDLLLLLSLEDISSLSFEAFLDQIAAHFPSVHLLLGKGSLFGKNREGSEDKVLSFAAKNRMQVEYLPLISEEGEMISSSRVRSAVLQGDFSLLQRLLARPFSYSFNPPFSSHFFSSPYASHLSLEFSLKNLVPLPMGSYEVFVETESKSFSTSAAVANDRLRLIIPTDHFSKTTPLNVIFCSKKRKDAFFSQNKIFKDLYV